MFEGLGWSQRWRFEDSTFFGERKVVESGLSVDWLQSGDLMERGKLLRSS